MLTNATSPALRRHRGRSRALVSLCLTALAIGCSGLLDVENPNNVNIDNLSNPAAAGPLANGALSATARALGNVLTPYSEATDELTWIGSRDAWGDLDRGSLSGITNEFVDAAFPQLGQARWLSDEAIKRLRAFDSAGVLPNRGDLARSYLYGAIAYVIIGDMFDDWPIGSDRQIAAPPLGPAKMFQVYDTAIAYTTRGIAIAQAAGDSGMERDLTAMRARARHAKVVWQKLNPFTAATLANPLVDDTAAVPAGVTVVLSAMRYIPLTNPSRPSGSLTFSHRSPATSAAAHRFCIGVPSGHALRRSFSSVPGDRRM